MNYLLALIVTVSSWMTFSVLNELASAKDGKGCCRTGTCGTGFIAGSLWWMNLMVALLFTMYVLMRGYMMYGGKMYGRFPKGLNMAFGGH